MKKLSFHGFQLIPVKGRAILPLILLAPIILFAVFAYQIAPYNPLQTGVGESLSPPSSRNFMGTDQLGEDIFSQVVHGSRVALYVGITSSLITVFLALVIGTVAGYLGGMVDEVLMRFTDVVLSIPSFILIIFIVILFGSSINVITLVIGVVSWPSMARVVRARVLSFKEQEFVLAAKALGANPLNVMLFEILPNIWLGIIPAITLQIGNGILTEAGLSFLGLGDPNVASWGRILYLASTAIYLGCWWGVLFPGLAIIVTIISFNLLGDVLGTSLSPK
ncbi:MAG: ABC transporter permease [Nitrososphaeria archaeon]